MVPPKKLNVKLYECGKRYNLGPLDALFERKTRYGLLVLDYTEATLGVFDGGITQLTDVGSLVFGKFKAGGQSAARFSRVREGLIKDFHKNVLDSLKELTKLGIKTLIIGGPGIGKANFADKIRGFKLIGPVNCGYTGHQGLKELVERSMSLLEDDKIKQERVILDKFFGGILSGKSFYGKKETKTLLNDQRVDLLMCSEGCEIKADVPTIVINRKSELGERFYLLGGIGGLLRY